MGGGIGMGNTCKPMAVSFQCMTKSTTNKNFKKKKKRRIPLHPASGNQQVREPASKGTCSLFLLPDAAVGAQ